MPNDFIDDPPVAELKHVRFTKMQGAGNDYVYIDLFHEPPPNDPESLAREMSDRHFGVGADGLILIGPDGDGADARMTMFNADGSRGEMCGNGLRCVAKYLHDHGHVPRAEMAVATDAGLKAVSVTVVDGKAVAARIDMGPPMVSSNQIPTTHMGSPPRFECRLPTTGMVADVVCVSMGNPHAVVFVDELSDETVLRCGPILECDPAFPRKTNVEFVRVIGPNEIQMRVWERGSGETLACGTGACAAVVAAALIDRASRRVRCRLPGGELDIAWSGKGNVFLTGPAVEVFQGEWP